LFVQEQAITSGFFQKMDSLLLKRKELPTVSRLRPHLRGDQFVFSEAVTTGALDELIGSPIDAGDLLHVFATLWTLGFKNLRSLHDVYLSVFIF
jgi:hypothetical protein